MMMCQSCTGFDGGWMTGVFVTGIARSFGGR